MLLERGTNPGVAGERYKPVYSEDWALDQVKLCSMADPPLEREHETLAQQTLQEAGALQKGSA